MTPTNLGMLLPMRAGHSIADYQQSIISDFSEIITDAAADRLCSVAESDAILFSTDHLKMGNTSFSRDVIRVVSYFRPQPNDQMKQLTESSRSHFDKSFHEEP